MLHRLYQQAVLIAKTITKKDKEEEAVTEFTKYLNSSELYFNEHPFPENESNEEAYLKCKSVEGRFFIYMKIWLIIAVMHMTWSVVKLKPGKISGLNGIRTHDLCNNGGAIRPAPRWLGNSVG